MPFGDLTLGHLEFASNSAISAVLVFSHNKMDVV